MLSTVPCSKANCVYQKDGMCMLETVKSPTKTDAKNLDCVYYASSNSKNQAQI